MRLQALVLAGLCLAAPAEPAPPDPVKALAGLDAVIESALRTQKIPGAAVGVVVDDRVVLLRGYGQRDVEAGQPMTPDTMIPIASVSKQFTVAALGTLVRQGKLDWDAPVRDVLPDFRLHDDVATLRATPRDLVTHRIGLPRHDWAWFGSTLPREQLYARLRHFPFNKDVRTTFQYNNFMFMTAGYLGGRLAGTSYEELVRRSLFEPLGMARSNFSLQAFAADPDHALGYQLDNERKLVPDPVESAEQMAPTGGINSTARDLLAWTRMLLRGGELDGKRILLQSDVQAMMQPAMPIGPPLFPETGFQSYGMGFFVANYRGHEIAQHGGNMPGAATVVFLVPSQKIGIVVLTNRSGAMLRDGLPYEIVDRLLGLPGSNLVAKYAELETKGFAAEDAAKEQGVSDRKPGTRPSHALADYAATYSDPGYGELAVKLQDDALWITYHGFSARLDHWHYDVFETPEDRRSRLDRFRVQFLTDLSGDVSGLLAPMETRTAATVFQRQPPAEMRDRAFLQHLVGVYAIGAIELEVTLREDGMLQGSWPGRLFDLLPVQGTTFKVKDRTGVTVEFRKDAAGAISSLAWYDGGALIAERKK